MAVALSTAAPAQNAGYPAREVLAEYLRVCDAQPEDAQKAVAAWASNAARAGWQEIRDLPSPDDSSAWRDRWTKTFVDGLNAGLTANFAEWGGRIVDARLFRKAVGDRTVYISMLGMVQSNDPVIECRLHDRLNTDFRRVPISKRDFERAVGTTVEESEGFFGEPVYRWGTSGENGRYRVEVHFRASEERGWPFGPYGKNRRNSNPYASFGLTLVTGWKNLIIVN